MQVNITVKDYLDYIEDVARIVEENRDYITALDAATGDGDHWANMNMGFQALRNKRLELENLPLSTMFKAAAMTLMNSIGGSSGVLYGSAYIAAAKASEGHESIDLTLLYQILQGMLSAIMKRGNSVPGQKTMIDAIAPAVETFKAGLEKGEDAEKLLKDVAKAADEGAESTKNMEAVRGRAFYQSNKGVGHLDPGAVTMAYQIKALTRAAAAHIQ